MDRNTIEFERADRFEPNQPWVSISHETLLRECNDEQIVMMIFHKAIIRTNLYLYRKHIPEHIKDWAHPELEGA